MKASGATTASGPILVTGADGFVGTHLLGALGERARPLEADVRDAGELLEAVRVAAPAAVIHLAAVSSVGESWTSPAETWQVNAVGTVNLVEALLEASPSARLLLVSTGEVYGRPEELPTSETAPMAPISPYGASKVAAEVACDQAARSKGFDVVVARAFQHEGPGRDGRFAIGSWTRQIAELELQGGGELLVGDLSAERDITDVRDVCRAYALLLDPSAPPGTYNVASGQKVRLTKIVDLLRELATCTVEVVPDPTRLRPAELPVVWGDASKLNAVTGWQPEIPLRQTLANALDYARSLVTQEKAAKA
jgi:GDP-4-dehydro-6-deoxy-D-mannose reductase